MKTLTEYIVQDFLCAMNLTVHQENGNHIDMTLTQGSDPAIWISEKDGVSVTVTAISEENSTAFTVDLISDAPLAPRALSMKIDPSCADELIASHHDNPWWMMGSWPKNAGEVREQTQGFILKKGDLHYSVECLVGDIFRCEANAEGMHFEIDCKGFCELHGPFLTVSASDKPYEAVENNYKFARKTGVIGVPLRSEKEYPALFEKFGWCSWNACYYDVTSELLYSKLDELKEKSVPVKWIIIDDGWSVTKNAKLSAFSANPEKFPEGLKECIRRIKEEYGIEYVGVWHAFSGYWLGVDPESELAKEYADCLMTTAEDKDGNTKLMPCDDPVLAFRFWDGWHSYLANCGVDFLKVDNQSSTRIHLSDTVSTPAGARHFHEAIERSINKNFGGVVINCMGMDMDNVLSRPGSAISRNSDDFNPKNEFGFSKHLRQNLYNAIWHSQMYYCDYDMWWSYKGEAVQSGVLRAISGGPVYLSDEVGGTALAGVLPVCGTTGDIWRLDNAALPTLDCLYIDCEAEGRAVKTYNSKGGAIALAVFNAGRESVAETFTFDVIPALCRDKEYIAYEYFTKKYTRVRFDTVESIALEGDGVLSYSLYPIENDGDGEYIMLGDTDRYIGVGDPAKKKVNVSDIL